jgi:hypothetical protein
MLNYVVSERDNRSILCAVECLLKVLLVCPTGRLSVCLCVFTHDANHEALKEFNEIYHWGILLKLAETCDFVFRPTLLRTCTII